MPYRPDIDGLRAIAVLAVLVYHLLPEAAPGGFVGVDVFFVISGYLITGISLRRLDAGRFSLADFYVRRVRRLLPALLAVVFAVIGVGSVLYAPGALADLGQQVAASALFAGNVHFWQSIDYFSPGSETRPLLHLWSLGIEEQWYLLAPLLLMGLHRRRRALGPALAAVGLLSLAAGVWVTRHDPSAAFYLLPFRAWELALGAWLAARPRRPLPLGVPLGLAAIGAAIVLFDGATVFPGVAALLPCLGTAAVLVGADGAARRALSWAPLRRVGELSYSLYLWHWPVFVFASFLWMRRPTVPEAVGLAAVSFALAAASHRWIEAPFRSGGPAPERVLGVGVGALAAVGALGWFLWGANLDPAAAVVAQRSGDPMETPTAACADLWLAEGEVRTCRFGQGDDILVWGDSHAASLSSVVAAVAPAGGHLISKNSCPPLVGVDLEGVRAGHGCAAHNEAVMDEIRAVRPATVVLTARWPLYDLSEEYGQDVGVLPRMVQVGSRGRRAELGPALESTVEALAALGAAVVLVDSVPEAGFDVTSAVERSRRLGLRMRSGPPIADVRARNAGVAPVMQRVARRPGVRRIEPSSVLCGETSCVVESNGAPLYGDSNHLSPAGAALLGPMLRDALAPKPSALVDGG